MEGPIGQLVTEHGIHETAVEASPNGVVVTDDSGAILYANSQFASIFGYLRRELLGVSIERLLSEPIGPTTTAERGQFWSAPYSRPSSARRELRGQRKDGSEVPIEVGFTIAEARGPRLVVISVVDISERKRFEREAQESSQLRLEFEHLISDMAARFVRTEPPDVDEAITSSLRLIADALGLDRCVLWQWTEDGTDLVHSHHWSRLGTEPSRPTSAREAFPWFLSKLRQDETVWFDSVDTIPSDLDRDSVRSSGEKSKAFVPMSIGPHVVGALSFAMTGTERKWDQEYLERLRLIAAVFAHVLDRRRSQRALEQALEEVKSLRDQLAAENMHLQSEVRSLQSARTLASESPAIRKVLAQVGSVAATDATVLLLGETGSGKEVVAQAIHDVSRRRDRTMIRVNCAAIPVALLESELFGRERGAYTGALSRQIGRFERAHGTTIFLDEVGDLTLEAQAKLLRVLQDHTLERLGGDRPIKVDVRVIAATNRDLHRAVADRTFREDLYYRLNVFPITVPPLRERAEDIPVLVWTFVEEFSRSLGKRVESISRENMSALQGHSWPGNVRELRNVIERAMIVTQGPTLTLELPKPARALRPDATRLAEIEAEHIRSILKSVGWRIRGQGGAADLLGMKPTTLESRMAKRGIRRPEP